VRVTLADLAEEYLAQHDAEPETTAKLRWLLTESTAAFGSMPLMELDAREVAAWRMTLPTGHRFEATQALRQTLARAVEWGLIDTNLAKTGVDNPQPPRREMRPFDTQAELEALAAELGPRYGPMVVFAATGLRPGE
jgi:integrase